MNYTKQIKDLVILNTLIQVETEIIKLRTRHLDNTETDRVLTELQNTVHKMKPYKKQYKLWGRRIDWDKIGLNPVHEFIT